MNIKLDKRIILQQLVTETNDNNFEVDKWVDVSKRYAAINNLYGREFWSAKALQSENTMEFTIRYSKSLEILLAEDATKKYRIVWNNKVFNIIHVDNIKYANLWLKIRARGN